jgi:hypothetical protein
LDKPESWNWGQARKKPVKIYFRNPKVNCKVIFFKDDPKPFYTEWDGNPIIVVMQLLTRRRFNIRRNPLRYP